LDVEREVLRVLESVLHLGGRTATFGASTRLLGALPELDSMAAIALLTCLEERFGFVVADDEIDGTVFATVGSLMQFVAGKVTQNVDAT
jgi:acyl carrier protein